VRFENKNIIFCTEKRLAFYDSGTYSTIASYNASVVKFYNATGSLTRFEKKYSTLKNAVAYYYAGDVAVSCT
jgi:hypothetical protein